MGNDDERERKQEEEEVADGVAGGCVGGGGGMCWARGLTGWFGGVFWGTSSRCLWPSSSSSTDLNLNSISFESGLPVPGCQGYIIMLLLVGECSPRVWGYPS